MLGYAVDAVDVKAAGAAGDGSCANIGVRGGNSARVQDVSFGVRNDPER